MQIAFSGYGRVGFQKSPSFPAPIFLTVGCIETQGPSDLSRLKRQFSSPGSDQGGGNRRDDVDFSHPLDAVS